MIKVWRKLEGLMVNSHLSANTAETVCNMSDFMTQGMYGCSLVYD